MSFSINPLDIAYRFQHLSVWPFWRKCVREAADPSMVLFKGRYYLFPSMSGGFWHSTNLVSWNFRATPSLPVYDYAPDAREIDGQLVVCASKPSGPCSFFRTGDPLSGHWDVVPGTINFFDPNLFQDDDGRVYLFQGCHNKTPITGQELDKSSLTPLGDRVTIIHSDVNTHGWERTGEEHDPSKSNMNPLMAKIAGNEPYIEGSWVNKFNGTYYLQYAGPGTQLTTYADGYYTSKSPLGPYTYSAQSPFSSKEGGFLSGAGHGSTIQDKHGNWWHVSTMTVAISFMFERRVGLWPAGFDADGVLFCNQEFGDWPIKIPDGPADPWSLTAQEMLVSYGRPVTVSSSKPGHGPELIVNENGRDWWIPADKQPGHWAMIELATDTTVTSIQINLAEQDVKAPTDRKTTRTLLWKRHIDLSEPAAEILVEASEDGKSFEHLLDTRSSAESRSHLFVRLDTPRKLRFVRVTGYKQPYGSVLAISGLRVFGRGAGSPPERPRAPSAVRTSTLDAQISWPPVPGALGYNIRYGLKADKLYISRMVYSSTSQTLGTLNAGHDYWVAVDAFNENGVNRGPAVPILDRL